MEHLPDYKARLIQPDHLLQVAALHQKAFADSALTKLGLEPVRRYYEWLILGPHECYPIGMFDQDNTLLGFCFSGIFRGSLSGFLQKNRKFLILWVLTHPWLITNQLVLDRIRLAWNIFRKKPMIKPLIHKEQYRSFGVLSIAVDPDKRGIGIAKALMDLVEQEAKEKGYLQLNLTVHASNTGAIVFYERVGWIKLLDDSGNWTGSMIKPLFPPSSSSIKKH